MTCIAAVVEDGEVWIGGDSAGVSGLGLEIRADPKVFLTGPFLMGFTTSFRMGQLLRFSLNVPTQPADVDDYQFMCTTFVDAVRDCLKTGGFASKEDDSEVGGTFIVGYKGKLYYVCSDYQVGIPSDAFTAVGCGEDIAKGSLYSTEGDDPKARVLLALKAAERCSAGVRGPFVVKRLK